MTLQSARTRDRSVLAVALLAAAALLGGCESQHAGAGTATGQPAAPLTSTADGGWETLRAGNSRFVAGHLQHPDQTVQRREQLAAGQQPQAVILACADSRVPPEIIFDTGLGDLFVVRVAGNTDVPAAVGSIEYAVDHLHVPLIVVLGHQRCGAVESAVKAADSSKPAPGQLDAVLAPLAPAVKVARTQSGDVTENAVADNVGLVVQRLSTSDPILAPAIRSGKLKILGCRYDLDSGKVIIINPPAPAARAASDRLGEPEHR